MKVLISMCYMISRTGAEWFVYDLALGLTKIGHSVIIYAPKMGDMVDPLRFRSIACVTNLDLIATVPDVIIGNTFAETIQCLAHFPNVPAISVCHDRSESHGRAPIFKRIKQYIAVDSNCAERLTFEHGIPESQVKKIYNGVDLARFTPRAPLPAKPKKAAIFSNYATYSEETLVIQEICSKLGLELTIIGKGTNNLVAEPEKILQEFDLVFAKARCAREAIAVGCAVILLNEGMGMAGMVTPENMEEWQAWNFGRKLFQFPIESNRLEQEIKKYSPVNSAKVSEYLRQNCSLESTVNAFHDLIQSIIQNPISDTYLTPGLECKEFALYLHEESQRLSESQQEVRALQQQVQSLQQQLNHCKNQERELRSELNKVYRRPYWRTVAKLRKIKNAFS